ncbi:sushi domain-containing protein 6 [Erpetoichthys calabaricus]|uniref:Sushi domain containing 6 n=1 Tax=Erpetoichthys calabaricus TaxID=27687 RepID=A0A8C4SM94_ERPCA|nr:sushi domain-containing protein 6 [Erpetoichthys calabaricus]
MSNGMVAPKIRAVASLSVLRLPVAVFLAVVSPGLASECRPPFLPENGGYTCHPTPCRQFSQTTVIEYFCDEGYTLKGDYKYLTCQNGEWYPPMEISCRLGQGKELQSSLGVPALSIVASTASSVALILLLVVLFVLLQPKLKSFHHSRRDQGVSGDPVSIVVEGVQVSLPSYEEAVYGSGGATIPPVESRVQIVLSEGPGGMDEPHREEDHIGQAELNQSSSCQNSERVLVHQAATSSSSSSSSTSSSWAFEHSGAAASPQRQDSESSDRQSQCSLTFTNDFSDDIPLLKEA